MDKESAIVIDTPDPSRDRQVSINPEQVIQMQKAVQNVLKQIDLSYLSAAHKALQDAMSEPLTKISQFPFQQMSESINVAMNQLRESMADIQQIPLNSLIAAAQQIKELQLGPSDLFNGLRDIDWDALNALDDDEIVPEEIQAPVQQIVESVPELAATYGHKRKLLTRSEIIAILSFAFSLITFGYTCIHDQLQDAQSAKQEQQNQLVEQKKLDLLQDIANNTQNLNVVSQGDEVVVSDSEQLIEDSVESDGEDNGKESHGHAQ